MRITALAAALAIALLPRPGSAQDDAASSAEQRATRYLLDRQRDDGRWSERGDGLADAMAALALLDGARPDAADALLRRVADGQGPNGRLAAQPTTNAAFAWLLVRAQQRGPSRQRKRAATLAVEALCQGADVRWRRLVVRDWGDTRSDAHLWTALAMVGARDARLAVDGLDQATRSALAAITRELDRDATAPRPRLLLARAGLAPDARLTRTGALRERAWSGSAAYAVARLLTGRNTASARDWARQQLASLADRQRADGTWSSPFRSPYEDPISATAIHLLALRQCRRVIGDAPADATLPEARALAWIAAQQRPNGLWTDPPDGRRPAAHGLALLALHERGNSYRHGRYKAICKRGLRGIMKCQSSVGERAGWVGSRHSTIADHAVNTLALAQTYLRTRSPLVKGAAREAARHLVAHAGDAAAWSALLDRDDDAAMWVGLALAALRDAKLAEQLTGAVDAGVIALGARADAARGTPDYPQHLIGWARLARPDAHHERLRGLPASLRPLEGRLTTTGELAAALLIVGHAPDAWTPWAERMRPRLLRGFTLEGDLGSWAGSEPSASEREGDARLHETALRARTLLLGERLE